jgi:NTE family protein
MIDLVNALRSSRVFAGLTSDVIGRIAAAVQPEVIVGGRVLFREGDAGADAFIVLSGRLRVERAGPEGAILVRELAAGDLVGEFALLTGARRTATVTAIRDSELGRIDHARFDALLSESPALAVGISRHLASLLAGSAPSASATRRRPSVVVLRGAVAEADLTEVTRGLATALTVHGTVAVIDHARAASALALPDADALREAEHGLPLARWLQEVERAHAFVLCVVSPAHPQWGAACLRQADLILEVLPAARLSEPPERATTAFGAHRQELLIVHTEAGAPRRGTVRWMARRPYDRHHHVRVSYGDDWARIARHLNGTSIGVAFGGGGARGLAHLGLLRALRTIGIPVDEVGGTSIGSLVAAQWATGMSLEEMAERQTDGWLRIAPHRAYTIPTIGLVRARALEKMVWDNFGDLDFEDGWIDAFACSANLTQAKVHFHRSGPIRYGCMASMAIPGIGPAFAHPDGSLHVDGAVVNNLPADGIRAGIVIAADVSAHAMRTSGYAVTPTGWQVLRDRLQPGRAAPYYPTLFDTILGSVLLGGAQQAALAPAVADVVVKPPVGALGLFDFHRLAEAEAIGFDHAMAVLLPWWSQSNAQPPSAS